MGHLGKNLVIALTLVAAGFVLAWLRFQPWLDGRGKLTDGERVIEDDARDGVRYAVWDAPREWGGELARSGSVGRAALSPDGRFLVFTSGTRGSNQELWIADLVEGEPREARPLAELNGPADDSAPAFGHGSLYFASDREGGSGGLDLYRASYAAGLFGEVELLDLRLQSAGDDSDAAPLGSPGELIFASDRGGDFDLYQAGSEGAPRRLAELASPFAEREPALSHDGRALFFASDRAREGADFDLWRSTPFGDTWLAPHSIDALATGHDERAPLVAADAFTLTYTQSDARGAVGFARAHSLELARLPGRPVGWLDLAILGALLLAALLAALAKRWPALDMLLKCYLVSLAVHLLLLWWFRDLFLQGGGLPERRPDSTFRVRLLSDETSLARLSEREGMLERTLRSELDSEPALAPARLEAERTEVAQSEMPEVDATLERPGLPDADAPERFEVAGASPESVASALPLRDQGPRERIGGSAPELDLAEATTEAERATASTAALERAALDQRPLRSDEAADLQGASVADLARPASRAPARSDSSRLQPGPSETRIGPELAEPARETGERMSGSVADLPLESAATGALPMRDVITGPARRADAGGRVAASAGSEVPAFAGGLALAAPPASAPDRSATGDVVEPGSASLGTLADLARPSDTTGPRLGGAASELTFETGASPSARSSPDAPGPTRREGDLRSGSGTQGEARPADLGGIALVAPARGAPDAHRSSLEIGPSAESRGPVALQDRPAMDRPTLSGSSEAARADLLADLAPNEGARPASTTGSTPARFERQLDEPRPAREEHPTELALVAPDDRPRRDEPRPERRAWEDTPYQNREGQEKLRALELHGGSVETERAVEQGLAYLARVQQRLGHWGDARHSDPKYGQVCVGKTGLALLAFLGAGHTHRSGTAYSPNVARAMAYLLAVQDRASGHFGSSEAYGHGIATYALAECRALTQDEALREPLERAVAHILERQSRSEDARLFGGWSYFYDDQRRFDRWSRTSITAWQVMALESARLSGLVVPEEAFEHAATFLAGAQDREGWFRYSHDPERLNSGWPTLPASTPAGLFALSLLGADLNEARWRSARRFVLERAPREYRRGSDDEFVFEGQGNLYFWYYGTLAMFRAGGADWARWNAAMKDTLLAGQRSDGAWPVIDIYAGYAQDREGDLSYSTALCVLSLEVYYRYYLPLLKVR